jgi:hypothetical protein
MNVCGVNYTCSNHKFGSTWKIRMIFVFHFLLGSSITVSPPLYSSWIHDNRRPEAERQLKSNSIVRQNCLNKNGRHSIKYNCREEFRSGGLHYSVFPDVYGSKWLRGAWKSLSQANSWQCLFKYIRVSFFDISDIWGLDHSLLFNAVLWVISSCL